MAINNPGANSVYHGVQTQFSTSIVNGIDVFSSGILPPGETGYITEDSAFYYITEDSVSIYITES
jgi:hypothetical protein